MAKWGPVVTREAHGVDPFTIASQLPGFCNSGNAGELMSYYG